MADGSKLVIVESPTKARKISGYLGDGYTVMASVGHIRDLAQPSQVPAADKEHYGKFGVDVNDGFKPYYIVGADKRKTVMYSAAMPQNLLRDLRYIVESNQRTRASLRPMWVVCPTFYPSLYKPYYPQPAWWSVFTS